MGKAKISTKAKGKKLGKSALAKGIRDRGALKKQSKVIVRGKNVLIPTVYRGATKSKLKTKEVIQKLLKGDSDTNDSVPQEDKNKSTPKEKKTVTETTTPGVAGVSKSSKGLKQVIKGIGSRILRKRREKAFVSATVPVKLKKGIGAFTNKTDKSNQKPAGHSGRSPGRPPKRARTEPLTASTRRSTSDAADDKKKLINVENSKAVVRRGRKPKKISDAEGKQEKTKLKATPKLVETRVTSQRTSRVSNRTETNISMDKNVNKVEQKKIESKKSESKKAVGQHKNGKKKSEFDDEAKNEGLRSTELLDEDVTISVPH